MAHQMATNYMILDGTKNKEMLKVMRPYQVYATQADIAAAWKAILRRVESFKDLDTGLLTSVERLIDFVTEDHLDRDS